VEAEPTLMPSVSIEHLTDYSILIGIPYRQLLIL
jgi:hypothetical protein